MTQLNAHGLSIRLPTGWECTISRRDAGLLPARGVVRASGTGAHGASVGALLRAANFELPLSTGDFGSGAVEVMRPRDLLVIVFEYDRTSAAQPLFAAAGVPRLTPHDFSPATMQRMIPGQGGAQRFFNQAGRAMCLYVVLGSHARRVRTVPEVNAVLATLEIV